MRSASCAELQGLTMCAQPSEIARHGFAYEALWLPVCVVLTNRQ